MTNEKQLLSQLLQVPTPEEQLANAQAVVAARQRQMALDKQRAAQVLKGIQDALASQCYSAPVTRNNDCG